jgi:DNA-binding SARP family transcriptional activator
MPQRLTLHFLGPPQIHLNDEPIALERRKMVALLAYLALEHGKHQRASLSALLWPDYEQSKAYKNIRQTLWEIQQVAGEGRDIRDQFRYA